MKKHLDEFQNQFPGVSICEYENEILILVKNVFELKQKAPAEMAIANFLFQHKLWLDKNWIFATPNFKSDPFIFKASKMKK